MKSKIGKKWWILGLVVVCVLLFFIFNNQGGGSQNENTVSIAVLGEPATLDPQYATGVWESYIINDMFSGLYSKNSKGELVPELAEKYEVSKDGKTYKFYLKDAKWSDGEPITAEDFVYSYKRMLDPKQATTYAQLLYIVEGAEAFNTGKANSNVLGVKAIDDRTLEIKLEYPAGYFVRMLPHYSFFPVPKHVIEKQGKNWIKPENVVTSGAYKLVEWKPNNHISVVKNPNYWDNANVSIENVVYYTQEDRASVLKRFRAGELDIATDFESDKYEWIRDNLPNEMKIYPEFSIYYFTVNTTGNTNKALASKKVRQALSMAIDREFITEKVLKSGEVPAYSFIPTGLDTYTPTEFKWKNLSKEQRIAKAKQLLKEEGFDRKNPLKIDISYNTSENHKKVVIAIASMWKDIGVLATSTNYEVAVHYKNMQNKDYQVGRAGWVADYDEPSALLFVAEKGVGNNYAFYDNAKFNAIMQKAKMSMDEKEKVKLYQQAEAMILEDSPYLPIYYYVSKNLVSQRISGFENNLSNTHLTKYLRINKQG